MRVNVDIQCGYELELNSDRGPTEPWIINRPCNAVANRANHLKTTLILVQYIKL
jgi:hypothetical protein